MATQTDDKPTRAFLQRLRARLEKMVEDGKITKEELDKVLREEAGRVGGLAAQQRRRESTASEFTDLRFLFEFSDAPATINVLPIPGSWKHPIYGRINITRERNQNFIDNFKAGIYQDRLPIDAEHETKLSGAFGWITDLTMREDGSVDASVEWTERGQTAIQKDMFKYFSPEWYDEWMDPATGETHKDVIIGGALTTRPFFKNPDLKPLVATELEPVEDDDEEDSNWEVQEFADLPAGMSYNSLQEKLHMALRERFPSSDKMLDCWITDIFSDYLIYCMDGKYFSMKYTVDGSGDVGLGEDTTEVERMTMWRPMAMAEWDTAYINDLPDSAFACILPGGKKDSEGKTTPRSLRMLPHHKPDGSIDMPHLRNALSREPQAKMSDSAHATASRHLEAHAKEEGVGKQTSQPDVSDVHVPHYVITKRRPPMTKQNGEPVQMSEEELKTFIESNPQLKSLVERAEALGKENEQLTGRVTAAEEAVKQATETTKTLIADARRKKFTDLVMGRSDDAPHRWFGELDTHVKQMEALAETFGEDSDLFKNYVTMNQTHAKQLASSKLFQEAGRTGGDEPASAEERIEVMAKKVAAEKNISYPVAYSEVMASEEGQKLYAEATRDQNRRIKRGDDE